MEPQSENLSTQIKTFGDDLYTAKSSEQQSNIIGFYDKWAKFYEKVNDSDSAYIAMNTHAAAILAEAVTSSSACVIEFTCGTGRTGQFLKKAGFQTIDGLDGSEEMLAHAKEKGIYRNLTQGMLTSEDLNVLESNAYDGAICIAGVSYMAVSVRDLLREVVRVVKPGGVAVYTVFHVGNQHGRVDDSKCSSFMEDHSSLMKKGKIDVISMQKIPYYEMFGSMTYCYLFKIVVL